MNACAPIKLTGEPANGPKGSFDPLAWLTRAALCGYRHQVLYSGDRTMIGRSDPCCYEWDVACYPDDRDLWETMGSTADEIKLNRAAVQQYLLESDFADRIFVVDDHPTGRKLVLGTQPMPPGARLVYGEIKEGA